MHSTSASTMGFDISTGRTRSSLEKKVKVCSYRFLTLSQRAAADDVHVGTEVPVESLPRDALIGTPHNTRGFRAWVREWRWCLLLLPSARTHGQPTDSNRQELLKNCLRDSPRWPR